MGVTNRFPSYQHVIGSMMSTFRRFPLALLCAMVGTACAVAQVELWRGDYKHLFDRLLLTTALGLPLFISLTTLGERLFTAVSRRWLLRALGLALLATYYLTLPADPLGLYVHALRFVILAAALHFLVAFVPYLGGDQVRGFWQYNKTLFLRFLIAALYSHVLYVGLAIALVAMDYLFGVDIKGDRYAQLWMILAGVFNTWFFLAGVPDDLAALNQTDTFPKGLKIFTQFVLLPLVGLYFVILFAYEIKIILQWQLPKGWVSQLVLWYSVVGILSLLLLYPLREMAENRWIKTFITWFFRALIPLIVLLLFAIFTRIADYGVTEPRYLVVALAVGLSVVTLYFIFGRARDIRIIPIVLCVLALAASYGPWSASSISESSQQRRLKQILTRNDMLRDGLFVTAGSGIPWEDRRDISSILDYLNEWYGRESIDAYLSDDMRAAIDSIDDNSRPAKLTELLGFEYVFPRLYGIEQDNNYFSIATADWGSLDIQGFDYLIRVMGIPPVGGPSEYEFGGDTLYLALDSTTATLAFSLHSTREDSASVAFLPLADTLRALSLSGVRGYAKPSENLSFAVSCDDFEGRFVVTNIAGNLLDDRVNITTLSGTLLIRRR